MTPATGGARRWRGHTAVPPGSKGGARVQGWPRVKKAGLRASVRIFLSFWRGHLRQPRLNGGLTCRRPLTDFLNLELLKLVPPPVWRMTRAKMRYTLTRLEPRRAAHSSAMLRALKGVSL